MSITSYAQNFEDIMLWRALKNVERGFYIDIGANDPIVDSVSFLFYEKGWRGVHVEPTQLYADRLREARPDESVEQVAVGSVSGEIVFYEIEGTGLSTADAEIAASHEESGFEVIRTTVDVIPLSKLLNRYKRHEIHWLKIDVEGLEKDVINSWGDASVRPWIIVVESTKPLTAEENYSEWQPSILKMGYSFAYFDGLNRFYVHESRKYLLDAFSTPPNVFDEFILSGLASNSMCVRVAQSMQAFKEKSDEFEVKAKKLEDLIVQVEARCRHKDEQLREKEARVRRAESNEESIRAEIDAIQASRTWKLITFIRKCFPGS